MEERSKCTEPSDASRVDYLLGQLRGLAHHDPSPALRERLEYLSSQRLKKGGKFGKSPGRGRSRLQPWLRPGFAALLLMVIGMAVAFVTQVRQPERLRARVESPIVSPKVSSTNEIGAPSAAPSPEAELPITRHPLHSRAQNTPSRRMIVRLPYSNGAIDTGTDATIRVSMSQAELVSLGFPVSATVHDRRVVAELTLGDDGLPRAVSVLLPLEVIRETK
jgi:hypothetical protein